MKKYIKNQIKALSLMYRKIDNQSAQRLLTDCLSCLEKNNTIIVTALGKNVPICEKFVGTLNSVGLNARFMHTNSAVHGDLGMIRPNDLVIVMSKSGNTEETIYLCKLLIKRKSSNWLLTCTPNSKSAKIVDKHIVLYIEEEGDPWNIIPNNSTTAFLVFLQAIAMKIIDCKAINIETFKKNHPGGQIGKTLKHR